MKRAQIVGFTEVANEFVQVIEPGFRHQWPGQVIHDFEFPEGPPCLGHFRGDLDGAFKMPPGHLVFLVVVGEHDSQPLYIMFPGVRGWAICPVDPFDLRLQHRSGHLGNQFI